MVNKKKNKTVKIKDVKLEEEKVKKSQNSKPKTTNDKEELPEEVKEPSLEEVKNSLTEDFQDEENTKTESSKKKESSLKKQDTVKKNWFKDTFSRLKNYRPTIEDIGLLCGFITLIICSVFIVINIIRKEKIIVWIILLCSGLIPLSICLDDRKNRLLEEKKQATSKTKLDNQEKKQDKTSHSNVKTKKKLK